MIVCKMVASKQEGIISCCNILSFTIKLTEPMVYTQIAVYCLINFTLSFDIAYNVGVPSKRSRSIMSVKTNLF